MVKLNAVINALKNAQERIKDKIETLSERAEILESKDMLTGKQQERLDDIKTELGVLEEELNEVEFAIENLNEYTLWE